MYAFRRLLFNNAICCRVSFTTKTKQYKPSRKHRTPINPGVNRQLQLLKEPTTADFEDIDLDDIESDFVSVGMSHKEHTEELELRKQQERYFMIKQKYFKEKLPNFLTWNDKQQIKYLHRTDPEQWTIDRLSESFPALPEVITKILKSNWTKKNLNRIRQHDEVVSQNWAKFKKGELNDLPVDVAEHLKKFTTRELNIGGVDPSIYDTDINKNVMYKREEMKTEFSDIITSYQNLVTKNKEVTNTSEMPKLLESTNDSSGLKQPNRRKVTLSQLKKDIETAVHSGKHISETEMLILKEVKSEDSRHEVVELKEDLSAVQKRFEKPKAISKAKPKNYSFLEYPLRINIPKKVHKKGCLYKLNDCYYDDYGIFLYRVPGMNGQ